MSKRKKKHALKISPATTLRPRLDAIARDVAADFLVVTMLRAYLAAPAPGRGRLDRVVPRWLSQRGYVNTLQDVVAGQALGADVRPAALGWAEAAGVDTRSFECPPDLFFRAYYYDDVRTLGEKSQAYAIVFWYTSPRKKRAQGVWARGGMKPETVESSTIVQRLWNYYNVLHDDGVSYCAITQRGDAELQRICPPCVSPPLRLCVKAD